LSELEALGTGDIEGVGEGDEAGAVGVGTGGSVQQIGLVGFFAWTSRCGVAFFVSRFCCGLTGRVLSGWVVVITSFFGGRPIAASAVALTAGGGTVPAAAGPSSRIGTSPFTTTR
jgi:hypothetical protein